MAIWCIDAYTDAERCWALMVLNFGRVGASSGYEPMGRDGYRDMFASWNQGFDGTRWELVDGATVVCEFLESGTLNRPWRIIDDRVVQPNGKSYLNRATM